MPFVKFRAPWIERGVRYVKNDIREVSEDKAVMLVEFGRAVRIADPAPAASVIAEPTEEALLDAALAEIEDAQEADKPVYKPGSVKAGRRK